MYQKYQTDALVLKSYEQGEADKVFALYTRDFGLVRARASAVRAEHSRMRYALQHYAQAQVGLVRGKRVWRIAGAASQKNASGDVRGVGVFARISTLVLRLVHGEEKNEYLFAALSEAHEALMRETCDAWATIEIVCVARVLYALGYLSAEATGAALFTHTTYAEVYLAEAEAQFDMLLNSVNKAMSLTQL